MKHFSLHTDRRVYAENLPVVDLAKQYGTPLYVYSRAALTEHFQAFADALQGKEHLICYAIKANSNLAILQIMAQLGAGFDIVSGGELARVVAAGGDPKKVVYSGVAKSVSEIEYALNLGIKCFNVESEAEMERINEVALRVGKVAPISIRVNPDVDAGSHPYISTGLKTNKFGVPIERAYNLYLHAKTLAGVAIEGIDCHIGSQLTSVAPFTAALERVLRLVDRLAQAGITFKHIDMGGGLGVVYNDEVPPTAKEYIDAMLKMLEGRKEALIIEPGRSMVANAGILVAKCEYLKEGEVNNFCIVDTAMNDMIRPSLYHAWMKIEEAVHKEGATTKYDIVGPICETGDFLGKERELNVQPGDYLIMRGAGAYGFSMSSNYNSRPRSAEVLVDGDKVQVIRDREVYADLWQHEHTLAD